jgi:hypothetical protein
MYSSAGLSVHEISTKYKLKEVYEAKLTVFVVKTPCIANKTDVS